MAGVGSMVQWPLTTERCTLPVVGAGGVCDGRTLYAALALGLTWLWEASHSQYFIAANVPPALFFYLIAGHFP